MWHRKTKMNVKDKSAYSISSLFFTNLCNSGWRFLFTVWAITLVILSVVSCSSNLYWSQKSSKHEFLLVPIYFTSLKLVLRGSDTYPADSALEAKLLILFLSFFSQGRTPTYNILHLVVKIWAISRVVWREGHDFFQCVRLLKK